MIQITPARVAAYGYWKLPRSARPQGMQRPRIDAIVNLTAPDEAMSPHVPSALALVAQRRRSGCKARKALAPSNWDLVHNQARYHVMRRWLKRLLVHTGVKRDG